MVCVETDDAVALLECPVDMAKNKARQPEPEPDEPIKTLFAVKGRPVWFDWLREYAEFLGMPTTTTFDLALREQAKRDGFPKPMPKRMSR